jgi:hypothetical protein
MGYGVDYSKADPFGLDNLVQGKCGDHCTEATGGSSIIIGNTRGRTLKKREQLSKHSEREMLLFAAQEMPQVRGKDDPGLLTVVYQENGEIYGKTFLVDAIQDLDEIILCRWD